MASRVFFWIGFVFILLFIGSLLLLNSTIHLPSYIPRITFPNGAFICDVCGSSGGAQPSLFIGNTNPDIVHIEGEWPKQIESSNSDTISLSLVNFGVSFLSKDFASVDSFPATPAPIDSTRQPLTTQSDSLNADMYNYCSAKIKLYKNMDDCTSSRSINNLFGLGYKVFANAHLVTTSFDVQLLGPEEQSVNQDIINWNWNISPKLSGVQIINADIEFEWKPIGGGETVIRNFWKTSIIIPVNPPPFFTIGQISLSAILTGFGGIFFEGLSLHGFIEQRQKKKEEKKTQTLDKNQNTQLNHLVQLQLARKQKAIKSAQRRKKRIHK